MPPAEKSVDKNTCNIVTTISIDAALCYFLISGEEREVLKKLQVLSRVWYEDHSKCQRVAYLFSDVKSLKC